MATPSKRSIQEVEAGSNSCEGVSEASSTSTQPPLPAFIKKLWVIVNDNRNHDLIRWLDEENGDTICIPNVFAFSNRILPHYFKHSNWQSFVRQLNMYGFRRVYTSSKLNILQATSDTTSDDTDYRLKTSSSSTTSTSASSSIHTFRSSPVYLFKNDRFKRNDPTQLHSIRRKVGTASAKAQQLQEEGEQQKPKSSVANQTAAIESNKAEGRVGNKFNDLKQRVRDIEAMHKSIVEETERIHKIQRQQHDFLSAVLEAAGALQSGNTDIGADNALVLSLQKFARPEKQIHQQPTKSTLDDAKVESLKIRDKYSDTGPSSSKSSDISSLLIPLSHTFPSATAGDGKNSSNSHHLPSISEAISKAKMTDALPPLLSYTTDEDVVSPTT